MFLSDVWKSIFPKSAAKLLYQTAKTCQYVKKNTKKYTFFCIMVSEPCSLAKVLKRPILIQIIIRQSCTNTKMLRGKSF